MITMPNGAREYSKFEKTRIISTRALQIAQGSPVLVEVPKGDFDPIEIAKREWKAGVIPIDIKPHKKTE
jgi:DNA-directed RNA polymerase subunit K/omega